MFQLSFHNNNKGNVLKNRLETSILICVCVHVYVYIYIYNSLYYIHVYTVYTVSHKSEYTPHNFVNILLYLFMWQH